MGDVVSIYDTQAWQARLESPERVDILACQLRSRCYARIEELLYLGALAEEERCRLCFAAWVPRTPEGLANLLATAIAKNGLHGRTGSRMVVVALLRKYAPMRDAAHRHFYLTVLLNLAIHLGPHHTLSRALADMSRPLCAESNKNIQPLFQSAWHWQQEERG